MAENKNQAQQGREGWIDRADRYLRMAAVGGAILLILSQLILRVPAIRHALVPTERYEGISYSTG
ncbi:hypothetical protein [Cohnella sp. 56]|uniref:hypothetical protein n=1 Tax=Cohnella sp. 56 TaxID=3113722 RepID=UPI0030E89463